MPEVFPALHYFTDSWISARPESIHADVVVYGGTSAGVFAAVAAQRLGRSTLLLHPGKHLGGMTTGGLGWTDYGNKNIIGGMARRFYQDLGRAYGCDEIWSFEPSVAKDVIKRMMAEAQVPVQFGQYLQSATMDGRRIAMVTMLGGLRVHGKVFIDATYEGDLLALAGVSHAVGRESNVAYGETLNGIQVRNLHQFSHPVDPYVRPGDSSSGLLPWIVGEDLSLCQGQGDGRVQAYCFRVCMTDDPALRVDWPKPPGFNPDEYLLATRWFQGDKDAYNDQLARTADGADAVPAKFDILAPRTAGGFHKTDTNNHGPVSSDFIGANYDWPQGNYVQRERIFQNHVRYQAGLYWHITHSPEIPQRYQHAYGLWGLARDEFTDTGLWPHQLYVREARRMTGDYVLTEHDCRLTRRCPDAVAMGSYNMDSHNCSRFIKIDVGQVRVLNEGDVQVPCAGPYGISYRCLVPRTGECENLLVPVCLSASHIAYGSVRMEPVFMALGEVAANAAHCALEEQCAVQAVDFSILQSRLVAAGAVLT
ncbi:MAG: FAD-dependent oxidoreductase [Phycisphaerae bacterium]|nr:FAD-dependent oxidoreductase [Phycisphaerae bacterium]